MGFEANGSSLTFTLYSESIVVRCLFTTLTNDGTFAQVFSNSGVVNPTGQIGLFYDQYCIYKFIMWQSFMLQVHAYYATEKYRNIILL